MPSLLGSRPPGALFGLWTDKPELHGSRVAVTPLEVLHEVGRATVFQERAAIRDIPWMWAQLRYCDAFSYGEVKFGQGRHLLHMSKDALAKRFDGAKRPFGRSPGERIPVGSLLA
jgi:hypothetical protein